MLGIKNRSESWRVSKAFIENQSFIESLVLGVLKDFSGFNCADKYEFELFWTGYRDYCDGIGIENDLSNVSTHSVNYYNQNFSDLSDKLESYNNSYRPQLQIDRSKNNYIINPNSRDIFLKNLYHTEIDIVIHAGKYLLIGEAKSELSFSAKSGYVLVHQLIRQYVMASILVDKLQTDLHIVPFVLAEKNAENTAQVKAMIHLGWLKESNILKWSDFGL